MKILSLGLDNLVLIKGSKLSKRIKEYSVLVDRYTVLVPNKDNRKNEISGNSIAFGVKSRNKILGLMNIYRKAKKVIVEDNVDVITVQDQYYLALLGLYLARKFRIGIEIQIHGFEKFKGLRKKIAYFVIPKANSVRVVSERMKRKMINDFKVEEYKITKVPIFSSIDVKFREEAQEKKDGKLVLLTVGRLVSIKNIKMQIEAMSDIDDFFELWIVGDGSERENLKSLVKEKKLEKRVRFLGWQKDLSSFYSHADFFLLTSNAEGWGVVIVEAIKYGLPIIMTDVGLAGEVVMNNESGKVIAVGDTEGLKKAIIELIKNRGLREKIRKGAAEAIKKLPTKEETLKLYKKSWKKAKEA